MSRLASTALLVVLVFIFCSCTCAKGLWGSRRKRETIAEVTEKQRGRPQLNDDIRAASKKLQRDDFAESTLKGLELQMRLQEIEQMLDKWADEIKPVLASQEFEELISNINENDVKKEIRNIVKEQGLGESVDVDEVLDKVNFSEWMKSIRSDAANSFDSVVILLKEGLQELSRNWEEYQAMAMSSVPQEFKPLAEAFFNGDMEKLTALSSKIMKKVSLDPRFKELKNSFEQVKGNLENSFANGEENIDLSEFLDNETIDLVRQQLMSNPSLMTAVGISEEEVSDDGKFKEFVKRNMELFQQYQEN